MVPSLSSDPKRELIPVGDISLNVVSSGEGTNSLIFLHGVTANHSVWNPIVELLGGSFHILAVDQRGHGLSDKPATGYTALDYSNDVNALIERMANGGKAIVVGHSLGSRNAIVAASRFPERVVGFVGIDFTPFIETEVFDSLESRVNAGSARFESYDAVEAYLADRYRNIPADAVARRAQNGFRQVDGAYVPFADPSAMAQTVTGLREDLAPALSAVRVPGLLVRGAESTLVTESAFNKTRELRKDLDYVTLPGADHYVPEEKPHEIAELVRQFAHNNL